MRAVRAPPRASAHAASLLQKRHFAGLGAKRHLQPVQVHPAGKHTPVEDHLIRPRQQGRVYNGLDVAPQEVVNAQADMTGPVDPILNLGFVPKRIGGIPPQLKSGDCEECFFSRPRPDLFARAAAAVTFADACSPAPVPSEATPGTMISFLISLLEDTENTSMNAGSARGPGGATGPSGTVARLLSPRSLSCPST